MTIKAVMKVATKVMRRRARKGKEDAKTELQLYSCSEIAAVAAEEHKAEVEYWRRKHAAATAEAKGWKGKHSQVEEHYDALVKRVEALAAKYQQLEEYGTKQREQLAAADELRAERDILRQATEEATQAAKIASENMEALVKEHQATVRGYEQRLVLSQIESDRALAALETENRVLRTQFEEAEKYRLSQAEEPKRK